MKYTHEGYFWFLPILAALDGEEITIDPKYPFTGWLWHVCYALESFRILVSSVIFDDYHPEFMFLIRELHEPIEREYGSE